MKHGILLACSVLVLALLVCGCSTQNEETTPVTTTPVVTTATSSPTPTAFSSPPASPVGSWNLTAMTVVKEGSSLVQMPSGTIYAVFTADGEVQGSGGCNQYGGTYTIAGSSLTVKDMVQTLMSCGNVLDTQERAYLMTLEAASTVEVSGNMLTIHTSSSPPGKLVYRARTT